MGMPSCGYQRGHGEMHTSGESGRRRRALVRAGVVLAAFAVAFSLTAGAVADATPEITSDKADYAPGETATLTGTNWDPGEVIALAVRGSDGTSYDAAELEADAAGMFQHEFTLPELYVESFTAEATGSSGATATTTFTDSNMTLSPSPLSTSVSAGSTVDITVTATKLASGPAGNPSLDALSTPSGNPNTCAGTTTNISSWLSVLSPTLPATMRRA